MLNAEPSHSKTFRELLQQELLKRCKANPRYSLRAFANFLGIESSRLSKILRGERPANTVIVEKLGQKLNLSLKQIEDYKESSKTKTAEYQTVTLDAFQLITDWHHYAILELMKVKGFKPEATWVARRLGVSVHEIRMCVERLERIGILEIKKGGNWADKSQGFSTHVLSDTYTSYAHKQAQEQILNLAIQALRNVPIEIRDQSSMMMATNSNKIQIAKKRITKFRRELCAYLEDCAPKDSVYQLSLSLFPLDKKHEN